MGTSSGINHKFSIKTHGSVMESESDRTSPLIIVVHGPCRVGKSTVIRCLINHYTRHDIEEIIGPVTVIAGKERRIWFVECPKDLNSMVDCAKIADVVLCVIDGSFGFEMVTFEFLNLLQVHGLPRVVGILTHLDHVQSVRRTRNIKNQLKKRFWAEVYRGAKLFYLTRNQSGKYPKRDMINLARFIAIQKVRNLAWRSNHPYLLVDQIVDMTDRNLIHTDPNADRDVALYGFLRGSNLCQDAKVHIPGVGDFGITHAVSMPDPCLHPEPIKRCVRKRLSGHSCRTIGTIYQPMAYYNSSAQKKNGIYCSFETRNSQ